MDEIFFYLLICFFCFFIFICMYLFIYFFFSPLCLFLWLVCFVAANFVFIFYWPILFLCAFTFVFFSLWHRDFISLWVRLGLIFRWSENKISYLGAVYKFLNVGMDLAVLKNYYLFCIFNIQIYILTNLL